MSHKPQILPEHHEHPDSWHQHTAAEGAPQEEHGHINTFMLAVAFVVSFGFVAVTILASVLYFQVHTTAVRAAQMESTVLSTDYLAYRDRIEKRLATYAFPDEVSARAGRVAPPLSEAQQRVLARYAKESSNQKN